MEDGDPAFVALGLGLTGCAAIRAHQTAETEQVLVAAGFLNWGAWDPWR